MKTVDFSETIAASDLKVGRCRQLIDIGHYVSIEGQGHFFTIYFPGFVCFVLTRPRYQVSVYRTIGPLVLCYIDIWCGLFCYQEIRFLHVLCMLSLHLLPGSMLIKFIFHFDEKKVVSN